MTASEKLIFVRLCIATITNLVDRGALASSTSAGGFTTRSGRSWP